MKATIVHSTLLASPNKTLKSKTGHLVPVSDIHAMAGRILDFLADDGLRRFRIERMVGEY
ncbi:hypothetical protein [Candidatus Oleimmundimicrobium sp.]|uniref:hypothetical protein n=1 Tax=Candidatus Oleimmundimicrobium sp. TaxID=3060597 RepID=UPI0027274921|nr:hypothetical protein [Candidatus Oleimmundimicrobium sp.]MDO8886367.1 hypothetical protein [Candidatus Oleimmundimicrobium sp.]